MNQKQKKPKSKDSKMKDPANSVNGGSVTSEQTLKVSGQTRLDMVLTWLPRQLLLATIFFVPIFFLPLTFSPLELNKIIPFYILVLLAAIFWLAKLLRQKQPLIRTKFDFLLLLFFSLFILSTIFSVDHYNSLVGHNSYYHHTLISMVIFLIFFYLLINNFSLSDRLLIIKTLFLSAIFGLILSLGQHLKLYPHPWTDLQNPNVTPFTGSHDNFLILAAVFLVFGLIFLFWQKLSLSWRAIGGGLSLLALVNIFLLDFNLGWWFLILSLILLLLFIILRRTELKIYQLLLPTLLIALSLVLLFVNLKTFTKLDFTPDINLDNQTSYQVMKKSLIGNYLLGSGPENFNYDFSRFRPLEFNNRDFWQLGFNKAGVEIWQLVITWGPLPVIILLLLIGYYLYLNGRLFLTERNDFWIRVLNLIGLLVICFSAFLTSFNLVTVFLFWLFLALGTLSFTYQSKTSQTKSKNLYFTGLGFSLLIVFAILVFFFAGRVYLAEIKFKAAYQAGARQDWNQSKKLLVAAEDLNPYDPNISLSQASVLLEQLSQLDSKSQGYSREANSLISQTGILVEAAIARKPKYSSIYGQAGEIFSTLSFYLPKLRAQTAKYFGQAIQRDQNNPLYPIKLGQVYYQQAQLITSQLAQAPENSLTEETRKNLTDSKNQALNQAEANFAQADKLKNNFLEAKLNLALVHEEQGQAESAQKELEQLVNANPLNFDLRFELGRMYLRSKKFDQAEQNFTLLTQLYPQNINAHIYLAEIYRLAGQNDQVKQEYQAVLQLDPENQLAKKYLQESQ